MNKIATVPKALYEVEIAHYKRERNILRWIIIALAAALVLTNVAWFIYERSMETVTETTEEHYEYEVEQDADEGSNYFIGRDGVINGEAENQSESD